MCARIVELFGKKLSKSKVRTLIDLAEREEVNLEKAIVNTYWYHTGVERCRSIFGAIVYAVENGEWEVFRSAYPVRRSKPLPKAVQRQLDRKNGILAESVKSNNYAEKKKRLREKMEMMGYLFNQDGECIGRRNEDV